MRTHLTHLDRAITRMLDERARLAREMSSAGQADTAPFLDDLLRRAEGDFPADALRRAFDAIAEGCAEAAAEVQR